jgi:hypothetical protein
MVFPVIPWRVSPKKTEKISETVELLLLGVALPIVYVSERQDGSLVVLDGDDRLRYLVEFLERDYPVRGMEFFPELNGWGGWNGNFPKGRPFCMIVGSHFRSSNIRRRDICTCRWETISGDGALQGSRA